MYACLIMAALATGPIIQISNVAGTDDNNAMILFEPRELTALQNGDEVEFELPENAGKFRMIFFALRDESPVADQPGAGLAPVNVPRDQLPELHHEPAADRIVPIENLPKADSAGNTSGANSGGTNSGGTNSSAGTTSSAGQGGAGSFAPNRSAGGNPDLLKEGTFDPGAGGSSSASAEKANGGTTVSDPPKKANSSNETTRPVWEVPDTTTPRDGARETRNRPASEDAKESTTPVAKVEAPPQWGPLVAALVVLCGSLGLNLYLGYMWMDLRLRYRQLLGAGEAVA